MPTHSDSRASLWIDFQAFPRRDLSSRHMMNTAAIITMMQVK